MYTYICIFSTSLPSPMNTRLLIPRLRSLAGAFKVKIRLVCQPIDRELKPWFNNNRKWSNYLQPKAEPMKKKRTKMCLEEEMGNREQGGRKGKRNGKKSIKSAMVYKSSSLTIVHLNNMMWLFMSHYSRVFFPNYFRFGRNDLSI